MNDNSGKIDLRSLSNKDNSARWMVPKDYWSYKFNPCAGFTFEKYNQLAVCFRKPFRAFVMCVIVFVSNGVVLF